MGVVLNKTELLDQIVRAVYESGWDVLYVSAEHPFKIRIYDQDESHSLKIYIWNLTHGGGFRDEAEYRVQLKVRGSFLPEIGWTTLILGWWGEGNVFAGFDFEKHKGTPGYSASIQIKEEALRNAYLNGVSAYDKGNNEVAIAFRSDFFVEYVRNLESLHKFGEYPRDFEVLRAVTDKNIELNTEMVEQVSPPRQTTLVTLSKKLRKAGFRKRVLTAYGYQCAFCGLQLDLVDAAHILPVSYERSTDNTHNGVALCALHHRAYDIAFVTFNEQHQIVYNEDQMRRLKEIGHDGGADKFVGDLRRIIVVPPDVRDRPLTKYVTTANRLRGWTNLP